MTPPILKPNSLRRAPSHPSARRCVNWNLAPRVRVLPRIVATAFIGATIGGCTSPATTESVSRLPVARPLSSAQKRVGAASISQWWKNFSGQMRDYDRRAPRSPIARDGKNLGLVAPLHPASRLAVALQNQNRIALDAANADAARAILFSSANAARWNNFDDRSKYRGNAAQMDGTNSAGRRALNNAIGELATSDVMESDGLARGQERARVRQLASLGDFLRDAQSDQGQTREEERLTLLAAMKEDVEGARRVSLDELVPQLPADPRVLELTNLRLKLLSAVYKTEAERAQARMRLAEIEAQWRAILRGQESERNALLIRLREERPRALEAQQRAEIARILETGRARDEVLLNETANAQRTRIATDFNDAPVQLGIVLPPSRLAATLAANDARDKDSSSSGRISVAQSSSAPLLAFQPPIAPPDGAFNSTSAASTATDFSRQRARLHAMARRDGAQWARVVARRDAARAKSGVKSAISQR